MKKIISFLLGTLILLFFGIRACSQSIIGSDSMSYNIKGNIVFLGIMHSGSMFEQNPDGSSKQIYLMSENSGMYLCSILPKVLEAAKGKRIMYMIEGEEPLTKTYLDSAAILSLKYPWCLLGGTTLASDVRTFYVKTQTFIMLRFLSSLYNDGLDGNEKTIEEAYEKPSTIDINKLTPESKAYFNFMSRIAGIQNRMFEDYLLGMSHLLEQQGCFVVVICGAAHVAKIVAEDKKKDLGYAFCFDPKFNKYVLGEAKKIKVLEYLANK